MLGKLSARNSTVIRLRSVYSFASQFNSRCVYNALYATNNPPWRRRQSIILFFAIYRCQFEATALCKTSHSILQQQTAGEHRRFHSSGEHEEIDFIIIQ